MVADFEVFNFQNTADFDNSEKKTGTAMAKYV
jgi:hypothetical protein